MGKHALVVKFFGSVVLETFSWPPFEPLALIAIRELTVRKTLLVALVMTKHVGAFHGFSVSSECFFFLG